MPECAPCGRWYRDPDTREAGDSTVIPTTGKAASAYAQFGPRQLLPTIFFVLPEQPLGIGESWDVPLEQSARIGSWNSSVHGGTTFRLGETEEVGSHECIRILIESTIAGRTGRTIGSGNESGSESRSTTTLRATHTGSLSHITDGSSAPRASAGRQGCPASRRSIVRVSGLPASSLP
jgi:hypothetical protein